MTLPLDEPAQAGSSETSTSENSQAPQSTGDLVAFIVQRYHEVHREELPGLIALARKVESVHAQNPESPRGLASFLEDFAAELERHMQKEEQVLFPLCTQGGHPMIGHPIAMMRAEHEGHAEGLVTLARLTGGLKAPEEACRSWRALYDGLAKFSDDLAQHIRTENELLFPRFGA